MKIKKYLPGATLYAVVLALVAWFGACRSNPDTGETEMDIGAVRQELHLIRMDIEGAITILAADDPELQVQLARGVAAADAVALALDAWILSHSEEDHATLVEATALAFDVADQLLATFADDEQDVTKIRLLLFAAEVVLRRVEAYAA